jgi:hypothetical protein
MNQDDIEDTGAGEEEHPVALPSSSDENKVNDIISNKENDESANQTIPPTSEETIVEDEVTTTDTDGEQSDPSQEGDPSVEQRTTPMKPLTKTWKLQ